MLTFFQISSVSLLFKKKKRSLLLMYKTATTGTWNMTGEWVKPHRSSTQLALWDCLTMFTCCPHSQWCWGDDCSERYIWITVTRAGDVGQQRASGECRLPDQTFTEAQAKLSKLSSYSLAQQQTGVFSGCSLHCRVNWQELNLAHKGGTHTKRKLKMGKLKTRWSS